MKKTIAVLFLVLFFSVQVFAKRGQDPKKVGGPWQQITESMMIKDRTLSRCLYNQENDRDRRSIAEIYTEMMRKIIAAGGTIETLPVFIPLGGGGEISSEGDRSRGTINFIGHGFFKPGLGFYPLIPGTIVGGLGAGVNLNESDVVYICLDFSEKVESRRLSFYFLTPGLMSTKEKPKYVQKLVSIEFRPVSSAATILDGLLNPVQIVGPLYSKINKEILKKLFRAGQRLMDIIRRVTIDVGVYRFDIMPTKIRFFSELKVLGTFHGRFRFKDVPHKSEWMMDQPDPAPLR